MQIKSDIERAIAITESAKKQHEQAAHCLNDEILKVANIRASKDFENAYVALKKCLRWCL